MRSSEKGRFLYECVLQTVAGGVTAAVMAGVPCSGSLLAAVQQWWGFGCSAELPGGRVVGDSEQAVCIREDGRVFPEALPRT